MRKECREGYGHAGHWCGPEFNCWLDPRSKEERRAAEAIDSRYDALAAQRDEGLVREAELKRTIEDQRSMIEAEQDMKATARNQRNKVTKRLAEAEKLLSRCLPKLISGVHRTEIEDFLASPGCADGEKS